jgi:hypothetical protein
VTKSERQEVAAVLREWAAWCLDFDAVWWVSHHEFTVDTQTWDAAFAWCETRGKLLSKPKYHGGATACLALCFAAAMVEAGDSV